MMKLKLTWYFLKWSFLAGWHKADADKNELSLEKAKLYNDLSEACIKILEGRK